MIYFKINGVLTICGGECDIATASAVGAGVGAVAGATIAAGSATAVSAFVVNFAINAASNWSAQVLTSQNFDTCMQRPINLGAALGSGLGGGFGGIFGSFAGSGLGSQIGAGIAGLQYDISINAIANSVFPGSPPVPITGGVGGCGCAKQ